MEPNTTIHATFPRTGIAGARADHDAGSRVGQDPPRLVLTVSEAAELLGISRAFAYELVARGELPSIRLGRRVVVPRAKLFELLDAAAVPGVVVGTAATGSRRAG